MLDFAWCPCDAHSIAQFSIYVQPRLTAFVGPLRTSWVSLLSSFPSLSCACAHVVSGAPTLAFGPLVVSFRPFMISACDFVVVKVLSCSMQGVVNSTKGGVRSTQDAVSSIQGPSAQRRVVSSMQERTFFSLGWRLPRSVCTTVACPRFAQVIFSMPWVDSGIAQGRVLSPSLFNVLVDTSAASVRSVAPVVQLVPSDAFRHACHLHGDEVVLVSESQVDLQAGPNACLGAFDRDSLLVLA